MRLPAYSKYKDSGVEWLGEVPAHWGLVPNRTILHQRKVLVGERHSEHQLLSLTKRGVIVRDISTGRGKFSADMSTSQEVRAGNLIFCLFDVPETPRTVGLSPHAGIITGAYTVFECGDARLARYVEAFYIAMDDRKLLAPLYSGLRNTIRASTFLGIKTPAPPPKEQTAIVRYLDYVEQRIQRYAGTKRKLLGLLAEQKQAIIHHAVTRGLDPDVPLKPSGVEWLGDVPAHWKVERSKWLFRHKKQINYDRTNTNVLSLTLRGVVNNNPDNPEGLVPKDYATYQLFCKGNLVFKLIDLENRKTSRVGLVHEDGIMSSAYIRLIPLLDVNIDFFFRQYFDLYLRGIYNQLGAGVRSTLGASDLLNLNVLVPPLSEQIAIAEYLDTTTAKIDAVIARTHREIELINEYRTRLIADVVTGKVDVREAAAKLPDESDAGDVMPDSDTDNTLDPDPTSDEIIELDMVAEPEREY